MKHAKLRTLPASLIQFLKFGAVGAVNTILSYLITNISYYGLHLHEQICNLISFLITVLISYLLNSRFVFRQQEGERQPWYKALAKVYASYALTELVLMGILLFVQERIFGIPHFIATLVNLCVTVPLNFLLNKFWAYKKGDKLTLDKSDSSKSDSKPDLPEASGQSTLVQTGRIYIILTGLAFLCGIIWSFTNLGYDGEYQAAMSYRLLQGDKMFLEMWEPHQTSIFLPAALMWIYEKLFQTTTGILLYLQVCGILIRASIAFLLYRVLRPCLDKPVAYGISLLYFMISPKDYSMPEFSNLQLWFSTLLLCCLLAYLTDLSAGSPKTPVRGTFLIASKKKFWLLVPGAVFLCLEVLAYPSCAIVFIGAAGILALYSPHKIRDILIFTGVCAALGLAFLSYFLLTIGPDTLLECITGMLALEPTHTGSTAAKLLDYGKDLAGMCLLILAGMCAGFVISLVLQAIFRKKCQVAESEAQGRQKRQAQQERQRQLRSYLWLLCSCVLFLAGFLANILSAENRYAYSVILLFMAGWGLMARKTLNKMEKRLYVCGSIIGGLGYLATLLLTDLPLSASGAYGLLAIAFALIPIRSQVESISYKPLQKGFYCCFVLFISLLALRCIYIRTPLSGKGQICSSFSDLSIVRTGPALGIISNEEGVCIQRDSYPEWKELIQPGDKVWIVGGVVDTLGYLYEDVEIAGPSTMSTPSYGPALLDYWRLNPDKYPDVIAAESYEGELVYELLSNEWLMSWIEEEYRPECVIDGKYWKYYFKKARE